MANPNDPALKQQHQDVGRQLEELENKIADSGGQATPEQQQQLDAANSNSATFTQMGTARQANLDQQKAERDQRKDQRNR